MKTSRSQIILAILTGLLALVQAGVGLFSSGGGSPFSFTTLRGESIQIWGQGIYNYDALFNAPINRGTDAMTLIVAVPLLIAATWMYSRGSIRGHLLLIGVLSYFAYNSLSIAVGVAYNNLFLEYIAYLSASMFALGLAIVTLNVGELEKRASARVPRRGIAILLFIAGAAVLFAWLSDLISWLQPGAMPGIASYTTAVTHAIDLAIIAPLCFVSGILILRKTPAAIMTSTILLTLLSIIGIVVAVQTVFQLTAGIQLAPGLIFGKAGSFTILSLFAIWLDIRLIGSIAESAEGEL